MHISPILYLFLQLNIWLCFTSLLMILATASALSIPISSIGMGLLLPSLLFYFIYIEDRRNVSSEDRINNPYRTHLVEQYRTPLLVTEIVALCTYELILIFFILSQSGIGPVYLVAGQLPFVVLALYGRLKQYPTFDSIAVGSTWAFVILFSVIVSSAQPVSVEVLKVFAAWFIIVFAGVESRNIQDIEGDTQVEKATLASYLGRRKTKLLEVSLKAMAVLVFWLIADIVTGIIVLLYLILLQLFRFLTRREDELMSAKQESLSD